MYNSIDEFAQSLAGEIEAEASISDEEKFMEDVFVDKMIGYLHEAQELDNGINCNYKGYGLKINGYDLREGESNIDSIDILIAHYDSTYNGGIPKLNKGDIENMQKRATNFLAKSLEGYYEKLEESCEAYDLSRMIHDIRLNLKSARIILLTNCLSGMLPAVDILVNDLPVSCQIWDIERLYRLINSGVKKQPVIVDFENDFSCSLKCIETADGDNLYSTYTSVINGKLLCDLYEKWGTRLLERNVRAFLQARGKVNRGIRDTILNEPNMFLAYNNGITVTADSVEIEKFSENIVSLKKISDFQIVNGGQTIASLWHTKTKNKASISDIKIQMKLTVINEQERIEEMTQNISKYSNTQNKVNTADFYANDPFHTELEKISRNTWAPDPTGGGQQSIWFYERSRGAYDETRNREFTPAKIRRWDAMHPRRQKFDKLMLGKIAKTWALEPYNVSKGGQKNFLEFTIDLKQEGNNKVDIEYFKNIISWLIIWKKAEKIISKQNLAGYRANIVTYTMSYIQYKTEGKLDLKQIWKGQDISESFAETINEVSKMVREHITNTEQNVTEWCKKKMCWEKLKEKTFYFSDDFKKELIDTRMPSKHTVRALTDEEGKIIEDIYSIGGDIWKNISRWGKLTQNLQPYERSIAFSIGKAITNGRKPSIKQANVGKNIYDKALKFGFSPETE